MELVFPRFHSSRREPETGLLVGRVSALQVFRETWIGDRYIGYLLHGGHLLGGRWHRVDGAWGFLPRERTSVVPLPPSEFEVLGSYWGERADLVLGTLPDQWSEETWSDPKEHGHCGICWETINSSGEQRYRRNAVSNDVCCIGCYESYVVPRSLGFIQPFGSSPGD